MALSGTAHSFRFHHKTRPLMNTTLSTRLRVLHITSSSQSLLLMSGKFGFIRQQGFDVTLITSPGVELDEARASEHVDTIGIPIAREISFWRDLQSFWRLTTAIYRLHPAITDVGTPKAGLLGGIAAWLNHVPARIYTLYGLRCETTSGLKRRLLLLCEWIACSCAHRVICVSESLRREAIALGIVDARRARVVAHESANGLDARRFAPSPEILRRADDLRLELGIARDSRVIGFVGRLTRDKGVADLLEAFSILRGEFPDLHLLLAGAFEDDPVFDSAMARGVEYRRAQPTAADQDS